MKKCSGLLLLLGLLVQLSGQAAVDSVAVDVNFQFVDGLYPNVAALKAHRPALVFGNLAGKLVLQEEEYLLKVESLYPKGRPDLAIPLADIGVICFNGLPYFRAYEDSLRQFTVYAGLRVRGRLSYYTYEQQQPDTVLVKAYNPVTGRPFRQQAIIRTLPQLVEKVVDLATGLYYDFNLENMLHLLAADPALVSSLRELEPAEAEARLQRCLLIFDDRHPLYLPKPE
ncbi:MAG: hypothetical protein DA408_20020 [Bacteroidetes bacterium]|nr:MAG: hypothetical protein C7N36_13835 [Bacteroidota bacterium]PTM08720.1 MAG: hypothetical protein DA408_20020 [Bacteroidota bacterium]